MTHDIIRRQPVEGIEGSLYVWLQTDNAKILLQAMSYGSVVPHSEISCFVQLPVPILNKPETQDEVNCLALEANELHYQAYKLEQEAMRIMDEEVIYT